MKTIRMKLKNDDITDVFDKFVFGSLVDKVIVGEIKVRKLLNWQKNCGTQKNNKGKYIITVLKINKRFFYLIPTLLIILIDQKRHLWV